MHLNNLYGFTVNEIINNGFKNISELKKKLETV